MNIVIDIKTDRSLNEVTKLNAEYMEHPFFTKERNKNKEIKIDRNDREVSIVSMNNNTTEKELPVLNFPKFLKNEFSDITKISFDDKTILVMGFDKKRRYIKRNYNATSDMDKKNFLYTLNENEKLNNARKVYSYSKE